MHKEKITRTALFATAFTSFVVRRSKSADEDSLEPTDVLMSSGELLT